MTDEYAYHHAAPKKQTGRRLAENARPDEPEWVAEARRLRRSQHWSYQRIADHLGKTYRQVYKQLNYNRVKATNQRSESKHRAEITARALARRMEVSPNCVYCASRMTKPPRAFPPVCLKCRRQRGGQRGAAIAGLALAGYSPKEIAQLVGGTENSIGSRVAQMRKKGLPIPYRRLPRHKRLQPYDEILEKLREVA